MYQEPFSAVGHKDVSTTMIYTHVLKLGGGAVRSPIDVLAAIPIEVDRADIDACAADDGNVDDIDIEIGRSGADKLSDNTDVDDAGAGGSTGGAGRGTRRARHLRARMPLGTYAVALHMAA